MSIENHLTPGETILVQNGQYYATEKRILKYDKGMFSENLSDLAYRNISSVSLSSNLKYPTLIVFGILMTAGGIVIENGLVTILGIIMAIVGALMRESYYKFISPGITGAEAEKWKISNVNSEMARTFVRTVREHLDYK